MPRATARPPADDHVKCTDQSGGCQIGDLFKLLGKSHTLDILHLFIVQDKDGVLRFVEVQNTLKLSPNTLSERLSELVKAGLLSRTAYNEIPPRVDYAATQKARDLEGVFHALIRWANQHDLQPVSPEKAEA